MSPLVEAFDEGVKFTLEVIKSYVLREDITKEELLQVIAVLEKRIITEGVPPWKLN